MTTKNDGTTVLPIDYIDAVTLEANRRKKAELDKAGFEFQRITTGDVRCVLEAVEQVTKNDNTPPLSHTNPRQQAERLRNYSRSLSGIQHRLFPSLSVDELIALDAAIGFAEEKAKQADALEARDESV